MRSLLSLLTLLSLLGLLHSKAVLQDNGYRELVVAISPDVPESQDTLDQIKNLMTEASRELFIASRKRAYYKRIKILLPKTWTNTQTDQDLQGGSSSIEHGEHHDDNDNDDDDDICDGDNDNDDDDYDADAEDDTD